MKNKRWTHGPEFLWMKEEEWPVNTIDNEPLNNDPEVKTVTITASAVCVKETEDILDRLMQYYSSWHKLKKAIAWLLKVKKQLLLAVKTNNHSSTTDHEKEGDDGDHEMEEDDGDHEKEDDGNHERDDDGECERTVEKVCRSALTVNDLKEAEDEIIKHTQKKAFSDEIAALEDMSQQNQRHVKKSSSINKLNPQMKDGILRARWAFKTVCTT
jgi:hypothetical protein